MDKFWLDRDNVDRQTAYVEFRELSYDPDLGVYEFQGERFNGTSCLRYPDGKLKSIVQYLGGLAHGVSAAWYPSGQLKRYTEMEEGVRHGPHVEWGEDGTKTAEERYRSGRAMLPR